MNLFDKYLKEGYEYEVIKAEVDGVSGVLELYIKSNFVMPFDEIRNIKAGFIENIGEIHDVEFKFEFYDVKQGEEEIIREYLPYLFYKYSRHDSGVFSFIENEDISVTSDTVKINVVSKETSELLNLRFKEKIGREFSKVFGIEKDFIFEVDKKEYENITKNNKEKNNVQTLKNSITDKISREKTETSDIILGKLITEASKDMTESITGTENKNTVVEGEVFSVDITEIKNGKAKGKYIVDFAITDGHTSLPSKCFIEKKDLDKIEAEISKGKYIKVRGKIAWDNFKNYNILNARSINKAKKKMREDNAEEKRVELHAHTKMSAMDGLSNTGDLIKTAIRWGHSAVAITDHGVVQAFPEAASAAGNDIKVIYGVEGYIFDDKEGKVAYNDKNTKTNHIIILAKNKTGLVNLYRLVSWSHLNYFYKKPRIPKSVLSKYREGLVLGSACVAGEIYSGILNGDAEEELERKAEFYDYLEIQPLINNAFLLRNNENYTKETLIEFNRKIVKLGDELNKPVVATCDTHYINESDAIYRRVIQAGQGYKDIELGEGLYFRTTDEMLAEFDYLGERAKEIVIDNPNYIAKQIEKISPTMDGKYAPKIKDSEKTLKETCEKTAKELYGEPLPSEIRERLDKELNSIIGNQYAVMYISAKMLVDKSMSDGYLVGSRGSVGSSFAATMAGITEVNPLKPHYVCPKCKHFEWDMTGEYECGFDMPEKKCPECGELMRRDGHGIPFETFLGFEGDKEPDIDLNFAGEYQSTIHKYVERIFGKENCFKSGTISTVAGKTALAFVNEYYEDIGVRANRLEKERIADKCKGVKRTTGQHPGGIVILPEEYEIYEFCPVQRPANNKDSDIIITHFDYHSIDENLLKLDLLGHDAPSMIRHLEDITGIGPDEVPLSDKKTMGVFNGLKSLDIKNENYKFVHGTYGIPEFGTGFVRRMLDDIKPEQFGDLVRIAGLSHGTNVWDGNAQEYIKSGEADIKSVIATRDDIMSYLIQKGLPNSKAFKIMEAVRKGKGLKPDWEEDMKSHDVPSWYIDSCNKISYMFPRAHAAAYVMMSFRIAYFKVYYPAAFYASFLSTKIDDFNWDIIKKGLKQVENRIIYLEGKKNDQTIGEKEKKELTVMELVYEMYSRGIEFEPPSLMKSADLKFGVEKDKVLVPFGALNGVGTIAAQTIAEARDEKSFDTVEDLQYRAKANKVVIAALRDNDILKGLPETAQISLF